MTRAYNTATTQQNSGGAVAGVTAGKNGVINGGFDIWQRGTSVTGAGGGAYTADRWFVYAGGQITVSRQVTGDTTNLPFIQYCGRIQRNSGSTDATNAPFGQSFETINSRPFAGKTVTFSYYIRKGANLSGTLNAVIKEGTGTDQNALTGYTGSNLISNVNIQGSLTTTWQRITATFAVSSTATELGIIFDWTPSGTAGAADYYEVTGIQIEVGSVATPFSRNAGTIQGELAACQRYYQKSYNQATNPATATAASSIGMAAVSTGANANIIPARFPVVMRTSPTVTIYSPNTGTSGKIGNMSASSDVNATDLESGSSGFSIYVTGAPGGAVGYWLAAQYQAVAEL